MALKTHAAIMTGSLAAAVLVCDVAERPLTKAVLSLRPVLSSIGLVTYVRRVHDSSGVPIMDYGRQLGVHIGKQRNPLDVSRHALQYYRRYEGGEKGAYKRFIACADWIVANCVHRDGYCLLQLSFPLPQYGIAAPWRSAMAQASALVASARAHLASGEARYATTAGRILRSFRVPVSDGGVTIKANGGGWWYAEAADGKAPTPRILNGMMFAVLDLWDYFALTGDEEARFLFEKGVAALEESLPMYDKRGLSYYDAQGNAASRSYHATHIRLLKRLYGLTKNRIFRTYATRWQRYQQLPFAIRLLRNPNKTAIGVYMAGCAGIAFCLYAGWVLAAIRSRVSRAHAPIPADGAPRRGGTRSARSGPNGSKHK